MPPAATRFHARHRGLFLPDEAVQAVCAVLPVGHLRRRIAYGPLGPVVGAWVGRLIGGRGAPAPVGSCAAAVPEGRAAILIKTDQRLLLVGRHAVTGHPTRTITEWTPRQVERIAVNRTRVATHIEVCFGDASTARFETVPGASPDGLDA